MIPFTLQIINKIESGKYKTIIFEFKRTINHIAEFAFLFETLKEKEYEIILYGTSTLHVFFAYGDIVTLIPTCCVHNPEQHADTLYVRLDFQCQTKTKNTLYINIGIETDIKPSKTTHLSKESYERYMKYIKKSQYRSKKIY